MFPNRRLLGSVDPIAARRSLHEHGYFLVEKARDREFCRTAIEFIDSHERDEKTEVNLAGTELRIWDSQRKNSGLGEFFQASNDSLEYLLQRKVTPNTLLAIKNEAIGPHAEPLQKGRWHLDSVFRQVKVFLFLTDTTELSGPFEFIPGSHRIAFKLRMLCKGAYLKPADLLKRRRAYQRIDDTFVEGLFEEGFSAKAIICEAGTLMVVNTSAIHRARPCLQGSRYALTAYYR